MLGKKVSYIICATIISVGLLGAGYSASKAMYAIKKMNRVLTVKGLAEQDVSSDLGIWEINYREIGNDLVQLDQRLLHDQQVVAEFLKQHGFVENEINRANLKVEDRFANVYNTTNTQNTNEQRYVVTGGLRVRSTNIHLIQKTAQEVDKLLEQGVPLAFDVSSVSPNPSYYYTHLDNIRPTMLTEAIHSAHTIAMQFAKEADVSLDGVQKASQGVFQIMGRDTSTMSTDWSSNESALGSISKKVRLVTTIDYRLK